MTPPWNWNKRVDLLAIFIYEPERFPAALEQAANDWDRYMLDQINVVAPASGKG